MTHLGETTDISKDYMVHILHPSHVFSLRTTIVTVRSLHNSVWCCLSAIVMSFYYVSWLWTKHWSTCTQQRSRNNGNSGFHPYIFYLGNKKAIFHQIGRIKLRTASPSTAFSRYGPCVFFLFPNFKKEKWNTRFSPPR